MRKKAFFPLFSFSLVVLLLPLFFPQGMVSFSGSLNEWVRGFFPNLFPLRTRLEWFLQAWETSGNESEGKDVESQLLTPLFQKEYADLMGLLELDEFWELSRQYPVAVLVRTRGIGSNEVLLLQTREKIPLGAFLVPPRDGMIVGQVIQSLEGSVWVLPFWNHLFSLQVRIESQEGEIQDFSALEKGVIFNFNSTLSFAKGDKVFVSDSEMGAYSLQRYNWDQLGYLSEMVNFEIVEQYRCTYLHSREDLLQRRYFLFVR